MNLSAQVQLGTDINGENLGDLSGRAICMPDNKTVAIGATGSFANGIYGAGHVRVYAWNVNEWIKKGQDIDGENLFVQCGFSVSMPDANTISIGAPLDYGRVRVYKWNNNMWNQLGSTITNNVNNTYFGNSIHMPDSNTIAISAINRDGNGSFDNGCVYIYYLNSSNNWVKKGNDIYGEATSDGSGGSICMPDANTVAIGATSNDGNGKESGHVRIYKFHNNSWIQKGDDIDGEAAGDYSSGSLSMPDTNTIAIGATGNDGNGINSGQVRVYKWNGSAWIKMGNDIDGEAPGDEFGASVSMPDLNTIAIGGIGNDDNGINSGHVRIYTWNGNSWRKIGNDIDGELENDGSGVSVSMPDSKTVAIGAAGNDGNGDGSGHVRIYSLINVGINKYDIKKIISIYPNPTNNKINIDGLLNYENKLVSIYNVQGELILTIDLNKTKEINISELKNGVYILKIDDFIKRIVKI